MSRQYLRRATVLVGKSGSGLLIDNLRVTFEIVKGASATPNSATIKVYNLTESHRAQIKDAYKDVVLSAGYQDNVRIIFKGNIRHAYTYREGLDIITEIDAGDGDADYRNATMNETLAAGTTDKQLVERASASMTAGTQLGQADVGGKARTRGKVLTGNTRHVLSKLTAGTDASWSIQDGVLHIVNNNGVLATEAILLTYGTGLLKAPKITEDGVETECQLNPELHINGRIKIDSKNIDTRPPGGSAGTAEKKTAALSSDGFYKVIKLTHSGDTEGGAWTSTVVGTAL